MITNRLRNSRRPWQFTAIRTCNELDILWWLGKEGAGIMKASTKNEGGSIKCYILYGEIRWMLRPVVANLCMEAIEEVAINSSEVQPKVWKRYVDDSFCIIKRNAVNSFHTTLNSIDSHISFTIEEESDQQIAFLDTLVSRKNNTITIDVFRKATHTDRYLDYFSHHDKSHKISTAETLIHRATKLPNTAQGEIPKSTTSLMLYELTTIPLILFLTSSRRNFPNHPHMPSLHQKNLFACFLNGLRL